MGGWGVGEPGKIKNNIWHSEGRKGKGRIQRLSLITSTFFKAEGLELFPLCSCEEKPADEVGSRAANVS